MMGLKGRIPVEPLDDERLTNIERRIVAGASELAAAPPRRRFGLALAFAATAAAIAIGAGFAGWQLRGDGSSITQQIVAAEPVRVDTTGERSLLDIGDARIESDPTTAFTVTRPDGGVLVSLARGKVELDVAKRTGRAPLVVAAGDTRVIVVGTRFAVDYGDGSGPVVVRVTEGVVKVERLQQELRIAAGQAWTAKRGVLALAELPDEPVAMATIDDPDARTDDAIEIETDTPDVLKDRTSNVPDAKIPTTGVQREVAPRPTKPDVVVRPRPNPSAGSGAAMDVRKLVLAQEMLPPLDLGKLPKDSIAELRNLVNTTTGADAALALYSIAYLQHMKLGRTADALRTLEQYVRRYEGTVFKATYHAALWLRVRILCTKAIDDRCRQAAYTHILQARGTPAAKVSERITLQPR